MNTITVIENARLEKLESCIYEIKESLNQIKDDDLAACFIESKKIPKLLGISQKTWQTYRDKRFIPFIKFGSKIWVKRSDIEDFLNQHYITKTN